MARSKNTDKGAVFSDRIVALLIVLIGLAVIGGLLTLIFAFLSGVISINDTPQTYKEFTVSSARSRLDAVDDLEKPQAWAEYIMALVDVGQMSDAKAQLTAFEAADLDMTRTQAAKFARAYIMEFDNQPDEAVKLYRELSDDLMKAYDEMYAKGGDKNWATAYGIPNNYYLAHLRISGIAMQKEDWETAIEAMGVYLEGNPTHAGILIDRGNAKLEMGDKEGALEDFNAALKFLPDNREALEGKAKAEE